MGLNILQTVEELGTMNEWGSIVALSYIAAQRTSPSYSDMAEAKALLGSIARSYDYPFVKRNKVRINTISQSPTQWYLQLSPLADATVAVCAGYIVATFFGLTRMVTM